MQTDQPDVSELAKEYTRAGGYYNYRQTRSQADEVRYSYWAGQSEDGKKRQKNDDQKVFPWDGASDTRIRLADEIVTENAEILSQAFWRANLQGKPTEAKDASHAAQVSTLLKYFRDNALRKELQQEVCLAAQYSQHYGVAVIHPFWERTVSSRPTTVTIEDLATYAAQAEPGTALAALPEMVMDPDREDGAIEAIQEIIELDDSIARKAVRKIQATGSAEVPLPFVTKNAPCVVSLKVGEEIFFPAETLELKEARVIFYRDWLTEVELREKVFTDGWSEDWVDEVIKLPHRHSRDFSFRLSNFGYNELQNVDSEDNIFEVVTAYQRVIGDDGIPKIVATVFNPAICNHEDRRGGSRYGLHREADEFAGEYPFFPVRREWLSRRLLDTRGVPEIVQTWQNEIKGQRDALYDRASIMTLPPFRTPARMGNNYEIRPGANVPELRQGEISFMEPPKSNPAESLEIVRYIEEQAARYFGRPHPAVDPGRAQAKVQFMVDDWLRTWANVFSYMFKLMQRFMDDADFHRITGIEMGIPEHPTEIAGGFDVSIDFDTREMDNEFLLKKMDIVSRAVLPEDTAGVIDRAALVKWKMAALDPQLAQLVVQDKAGASQKVFDEVNNNVALMALGNEPRYTEIDPTAQMKAEFLRQILERNPKYQQAQQQDEHFAKLLENYQKNLEMSVMQEQNKQVGRLGVQQMQ